MALRQTRNVIEYKILGDVYFSSHGTFSYRNGVTIYEDSHNTFLGPRNRRDERPITLI